MTKGIYYILNTQSKRVYVGSSKQIEKRLKQHKKDLELNRHCNVQLTRAWAKYNENDFIFGILEEMSSKSTRKQLLENEQKYLNVNDGGYNIAPANGGDCISNHPDNKQIREKIKRGVRKQNDSLSKEERLTRWSRPGEMNPNWKGGPDIKICPVCNNTEIYPHNKTCIKCKDQSGENNPFYNKHHSEETKAILREKMSGDNSWIKDIDPEELPYTKQYQITYPNGNTKTVHGLKCIADEFEVSIPCVHGVIERVARGVIPQRGKFKGIRIEQILQAG